MLHPIFLPRPPGYSVLCNCGHYTFYVDEADKPAYEAKYGKLPAGKPAASAATPGD